MGFEKAGADYECCPPAPADSDSVPTPTNSHALMALQQERAAFPSPDVPHDDAVVRGS